MEIDVELGSTCQCTLQAGDLSLLSDAKMLSANTTSILLYKRVELVVQSSPPGMLAPLDSC